MGNVETSGPNEALVISGGCFGSENISVIVGGWGWRWWGLTDVQRLSLNVMTLVPRCKDAETLEGVAVAATGVAQVKVMYEHEFLLTACKHFLGRDVNEIKDTLLHTMEGHLRSILGTLSVEAIYKDRESFARLVREVAAPDLAAMGVELLSFTIRDLADRVQYLDSLGRPTVAAAKRDTAVGVSEAHRDASIQEAGFQKQLVDARCKVETLIAEEQSRFKSLRAQYEQEVNTAKAQAELAFDLQSAKDQQAIRGEEVGVEVVQRRLEGDIEQQEILCNQRRLEYTVCLPAQAESERTQMLARAQSWKTVLEAQASSESTRLLSAAQAQALAAQGSAEAEGLVRRAAAFESFSDAAKLSSTLEALPAIAAQLAAPLAATREVVLVSGDGADPSTSLDQFIWTAKDFFCGTLPAEFFEQLDPVKVALGKGVKT